jgi:hypothetical protein
MKPSGSDLADETLLPSLPVFTAYSPYSHFEFLCPLEDEEFEEAPVMMQRNPPFSVMIVDIQRIVCSPIAPVLHDIFPIPRFVRGLQIACHGLRSLNPV